MKQSRSSSDTGRSPPCAGAAIGARGGVLPHSCRRYDEPHLHHELVTRGSITKGSEKRLVWASPIPTAAYRSKFGWRNEIHSHTSNLLRVRDSIIGKGWPSALCQRRLLKDHRNEYGTRPPLNWSIPIPWIANRRRGSRHQQSLQIPITGERCRCHH